MTSTHAAAERQPRRGPFSDTWWAFFSLLAALHVAVSAAYFLGAEGVDLGSSVSFERKKDRFLFRVDEKKGFLLHGSGDSAALVRTKRAWFPLRPICGQCQLDGSLVSLATHRHGSWVYTERPLANRPAAHNLATGEELRVAPFELGRDPVPREYAARGLALAEAERITVRSLGEQYENGRLVKESCLIFQAAFVVLHGVMVFWGLVELAVGLARRARRTARGGGG